MIKKPIEEVLLASEKRKRILLILLESPQEMETLLVVLGTTRSGLLPQMKMLLKSHLISKHKDSYKLTTIGRLIAKKMASFLCTAETFGGNCDYMGTHYLDFIPEPLLERLPNIGTCTIIDTNICDVFEGDEKLLENANGLKYWFEISSIVHPTFHDFYMEMADYGMEVSVIISREVYEKIRQDYYENFKEIIDLGLVSFYLYPEKLEFASFILSGDFMEFKLFTMNGIYDPKKLHICSPATFDWGKELFEYYRKQSKLIIDV
ncbi:MAG: winged helix-turn-helix domain-containing protein [Methanolobus sp.]|uniref:helix-turn-helix transcriptional regulator n=1 Tax=Methanolobus sp. TaxID=1874737 RepID=UPI00272F5E81|nr:winged helix-turn-helix domain-containing protein [Methanolobus sp.]MDP2216100.1 winged helix-turn-helix domain-containing protein [Methanolobus sp.]